MVNPDADGQTLKP